MADSDIVVRVSVTNRRLAALMQPLSPRQRALVVRTLIELGFRTLVRQLCGGPGGNDAGYRRRR